MATLLIRDISEPTKTRLAVRAAQNGRSQQAEALSILESSLKPSTQSWFESLRHKAEEVGGIDLPALERHSPRVTGVML